MNYCDKCGNKINVNEKFCANCGNKLINFQNLNYKNANSNYMIGIVIGFLINFLVSLFVLILLLAEMYIAALVLTLNIIFQIIFFVLFIKMKKNNFENKKIVYSILIISYVLFFIFFLIFINSSDNYIDNDYLIKESESKQSYILDYIENNNDFDEYINAIINSDGEKYSLTLNYNSNNSFEENLIIIKTVISNIKKYNYEKIDKYVSSYNFVFYENTTIKYQSLYLNDYNTTINTINITDMNGNSKEMTTSQIDEYIVAKEKKLELQKIKDYKDSCKSYEYKDLLRNPKDYEDKNIYWFAEVLQVIDDNTYLIEVNCEKNYYVSSGYICDDIVYLKDSSNSNLLEEDIIELWGVFEGTQSYYNALDIKKTVPKINAKYIEIK